MTRRAAAEALGRNEKTLWDWSQEPDFPKPINGDWDVDAIRAWEAARGKATPEENLEHAEVLKAIKVEELRKKKAEADRLERIEAVASEDMLPRAEYEAFCAEAIISSRETIARLPNQLASFVPKECRPEFLEEAKRLVVQALNEFARALEDGPNLASTDDEA